LHYLLRVRSVLRFCPAMVLIIGLALVLVCCVLLLLLLLNAHMRHNIHHSPQHGPTPEAR